MTSAPPSGPSQILHPVSRCRSHFGFWSISFLRSFMPTCSLEALTNDTMFRLQSTKAQSPLYQTSVSIRTLDRGFSSLLLLPPPKPKSLTPWWGRIIELRALIPFRGSAFSWSGVRVCKGLKRQEHSDLKRAPGHPGASYSTHSSEVGERFCRVGTRSGRERVSTRFRTKVRVRVSSDGLWSSCWTRDQKCDSSLGLGLAWFFKIRLRARIRVWNGFRIRSTANLWVWAIINNVF